MSNKSKKNKKANINLFGLMHKHKKQIVMVVSLLLVAAMILSAFGQFAFRG
ncbi:MAG: hypothetical protein RR627_04930 [Niameybacter sp.]